jgi:heme-degrading monooxygenase HmoA
VSKRREQGASVDVSAVTRTVTLINAFEVPPDADERFVAAWEGARDLLESREGFGRGALYRALRPDAPFRFVGLALVDSAGASHSAISDPGLPGGTLPFPAHPALYDVLHEDGTPDGDEGVVLINAFEVGPDGDERFLTGWDRQREALAGRPGYLGTRLHRSLGPADFRLVDVARWSSPLAFSKAVEHPGFQDAAAAMPFASHPALYQAIRH